MEKRRRIKTDGFPLPEVLIQHIQSFLNGKEAAQTSILSKSWYAAWSTRPNLEFDQRNFQAQYRNFGTEDLFLKFVKLSIQRYEVLNLKIESFRLWVHNVRNSDRYVAREIIVKAMKMGAVDFNFEISNGNQHFPLPSEVLGSKTLSRLSLYGCKIESRADREVRCCKLKSLHLDKMWVEDDIIGDLISSCSLIEKLTLGLISVQHPVLDVKAYGLGSSNLYKLKSLFLSNVDVDALFFSNLSSKFPCLKDLSIDQCRGFNYKGIQISSPSLECISFTAPKRLLRANLDVPSIRKFKFAGSSWPSLFFKTPSKQWESEVYVGGSSSTTAWFLKLKKLLIGLSSSKISLSFCIWSIAERRVDFSGLPETAVEDLTIRAPPSVWFTILECLFRSCRPKLIDLHLVYEWGRGEKVKHDFLEIVSKRNVEGVREKCLMMNHDLEEVDVQFFGESCVEGRPLPRKIAFQFKWRGGSG